MMKRLVSTAALLAVAALTFAEENPRGNVEAAIGGKKVTIDYGRPALKGRKLVDLMKDLPDDRVWRAGENQVTMLHTEGDITIGDQKLDAGKYSLYVHAPAEGDWSLLVNTNQGVPLGKIWAEAPEDMKKAPWPMLDGYKKATEVARIKLSKGDAGDADMFTLDMKEGKLMMSWGDQAWSTMVKAVK